MKNTVQSIGEVQVCRDKSSGLFENICSSNLVPGDIILIPPQGCTMHVDAVLLDGSCIVNESMLTGNFNSISYFVIRFEKVINFNYLKVNQFLLPKLLYLVTIDFST